MDMVTTSLMNATELMTTQIIDNVTIFENITESSEPPPVFNIPRSPVTTKVWLTPLVLGLMTIIGVVGNSIVIYAVLKNDKIHTVTNFYIVNLALTDIMFLIFVAPFIASLYASNYGTWVFGRGMCKFVNYMQLTTAQATCLTLTAMSVDRYQAIVYPLKSLRTRTTKAASLISIYIWTYSLLVSTPLLIYIDIWIIGPFSYCVEVWPSHLEHILYPGYVIYMCIVIYAIPVAIISCCYAHMLRKLYNDAALGEAALTEQAQKRKARKMRKITYMVLFVVIVFALCWFPFHFVNLWQRVGTTYPKGDVGGGLKIFARVLTYANSCLNPFVYAFMGTQDFRKYLKQAFPCCYSNKPGLDLSSSDRRSVTQEKTVVLSLHDNKTPETQTI